MKTQIKICGITNPKDALWVSNAGANFIGINFYKSSPRKISLPMAKEILKVIPPFVEAVGVFANEDEENLKKILKKLNLKILQFHGVESPQYCKFWQDKGYKIIKAFKVLTEVDLNLLQEYLDVCNYFLLDSKIIEKPSEEPFTSTSFHTPLPPIPLQLAIKAKQYNKPFFLAGGLTPENVKEVIEDVAPYGVDVASGVEKTPRRKDLDKVELFIKQTLGLKI